MYLCVYIHPPFLQCYPLNVACRCSHVHRTMRTVSSSARLNKVTASEILHQFLMSRSHDCCLQRGPLFPIFPMSFWWLFNTWPGLEAILLDSPAIVQFRELWHDCFGKYGFLLISHSRFPLLSMMLKDTISFIFHVGTISLVLGLFHSASENPA